MEDVYPRVPKTDVREIYLQERGRSRIAYIPWDIDRTYWDVMCVDHGRLLRNVVAWALNEPPVLEVTGRGVLDVAVWRQKQSLTVHLVNLTNPMMMKGPLREVIPVGPLTVRVRMPDAARAKEARLLTAGVRAGVRESNGSVTLTVPSVEVHEVIAFDL